MQGPYLLLDWTALSSPAKESAQAACDDSLVELTVGKKFVFPFRIFTSRENHTAITFSLLFVLSGNWELQLMLTGEAAASGH